MLSPGVPLTHPAPHWTVERARAAGVQIMGDIELFARTVAAAPSHRRPKIVAITGTNGKSTTTALVGHVCRQAGRDVRIGGNIGVGVLGLEDMHGGAVYVLELSSYQLDLTSSLKPDVAIILNISPDHLERHGDMDGYVAAKKRILLNQGKGDTAVVGVDDAWCQQIVTEITAANRRTIVPISARRSMGRGVYALQGVLYDATGERVTEICRPHARRLPAGPPQLAERGRRLRRRPRARPFRAGRRAGPDDLPGPRPPDGDGGRDRPGALRQRLEGHQRRRRPPGAVQLSEGLLDRRRAAEGRRHREPGRPLRVGGQGLPDRRGRGRSSPPRSTAARPTPAAGPWTRPCAPPSPTPRRRGEDAIVLLSPACASFDQFADFEDRGEAFRAAVHQLTVPVAREVRA